MVKDYLVEMVYLGKLHEPFGVYHGTNVENVIESLKHEVDSQGYPEYLEGGVKFISPNNESHWMVYEYNQ